MADLSAINEKLTQEDVQVGGDQYTEASEFIRPIEEGTYIFVQGKVLDTDFSATKKGALQVALTHTVNGGEFDGKVVTFDRVNTSTFDRGGVPACSFIDHLRALGDRRQFSLKDTQALADAIAAGEGKRFKGIGRWEYYCPDCGETAIKGAKKNPAPRLANGLPNHVAKCPKCERDIGANFRIDRRLAVSETNGSTA